MQNDTSLLLVAVFISSGLCTVFAVFAVALDNFRHGAAGGVALAAGLMPWIVLGMVGGWIPGLAIFIYLTSPLFLVSLLVYCFDGRPPGARAAAACAVPGMLAGIAFSFCLYRFLLLRE